MMPDFVSEGKGSGQEARVMEADLSVNSTQIESNEVK